eukprot:TRINITY_DN3051_c1_g1_i3.p1 TRINITY_DN3051_c1_g1~~TRINITY_DN3051_c1_g1_i3.p1  ORF type:complete len:529 (+),score=104.59 TRINITY_DN3051_c1_g1_i3:51-1637(+)
MEVAATVDERVQQQVKSARSRASAVRQQNTTLRKVVEEARQEKLELEKQNQAREQSILQSQQVIEKALSHMEGYQAAIAKIEKKLAKKHNTISAILAGTYDGGTEGAQAPDESECNSNSNNSSSTTKGNKPPRRGLEACSVQQQQQQQQQQTKAKTPPTKDAATKTKKLKSRTYEPPNSSRAALTPPALGEVKTKVVLPRQYSCSDIGTHNSRASETTSPTIASLPLSSPSLPSGLTKASPRKHQQHKPKSDHHKSFHDRVDEWKIKGGSLIVPPSTAGSPSSTQHYHHALGSRGRSAFRSSLTLVTKPSTRRGSLSDENALDDLEANTLILLKDPSSSSSSSSSSSDVFTSHPSNLWQTLNAQCNNLLYFRNLLVGDVPSVVSAVTRSESPDSSKVVQRRKFVKCIVAKTHAPAIVADRFFTELETVLVPFSPDTLTIALATIARGELREKYESIVPFHLCCALLPHLWPTDIVSYIPRFAQGAGLGERIARCCQLGGLSSVLHAPQNAATYPASTDPRIPRTRRVR